MAGSRRLDPAAVTALLRRRWKGGYRRWLDGAGGWPLTIGLGPPTERETARDPIGVRDWVESWAALQGADGHRGELIWSERQWPGLGRQRLPERLVLTAPGDVAAWAGETGRWSLVGARAARLRSALAKQRKIAWAGERGRTPATPDPLTAESAASDQPTTLRLGRHFDWLADTPAADFERLLAVLLWLTAHPDSNLYIRQLPIPGIDTKWIAANRGRLVDLLGQCDGQDAGRSGDLHRLAGLRREPDVMRLRILDAALRAAVGGLGDITAPVEQIAALPLSPDLVFIVENLQTGLAFGDLPGAVCFMARGYAVEPFAAIPWLRGRQCHYWGDLDTHGFAILSRLRRHLPGVRSVLMDTDTLLRHRDLWQPEEQQAQGPLDRLTGDEQALYQGLLEDRWGHQVRLEQERVDWTYAWAQVRAALGRAPAAPAHHAGAQRRQDRP
jgi:hypothetical protein